MAEHGEGSGYPRQIDAKRLIDADLSLSFGDEYAALSKIQEPKWRVKALLTLIESDRKNGTEKVSNKFVAKTDAIFAGLPKTKELVSFSMHDLPIHHARRKRIYEQLHPEVKAGTAGAIASNKAQGKGDATENISVASYATDASAATGTAERTVRGKLRKFAACSAPPVHG